MEPVTNGSLRIIQPAVMVNRLQIGSCCKVFFIWAYCSFSVLMLFGQQMPTERDSITIKTIFERALTGENLNNDLLFLTKKSALVYLAQST